MHELQRSIEYLDVWDGLGRGFVVVSEVERNKSSLGIGAPLSALAVSISEEGVVVYTSSTEAGQNYSREALTVGGQLRTSCSYLQVLT